MGADKVVLLDQIKIIRHKWNTQYDSSLVYIAGLNDSAHSFIIIKLTIKKAENWEKLR